MLTVYYSPHATSVDNQAGRASGHADVSLSEQGREEARSLARHYAAIPVDAVFCSDLRRAADTAALVFGACLGSDVSITPDTRLREFDYGALTQSPRELVEAEFPHRISAPFPQGESMLDVAERMGVFLRDALAARDGATIAVIGHRATKWGLDYWCGQGSLEQIVLTPWTWRDVPIWRYSVARDDLSRRTPILVHSESTPHVV